MPQHMPLNWLRAFEVSARHLNFSAAARELHVTPAAVSQQVRLLENRVGRALFERNARGLRLTHAGDSLLPVCRESFERLEASLEELFGTRKGDRMVVRVVFGFARAWLLDVVSGFTQAHPDIPVRLTASIWPAEPLDSSVDVDLRLASAPPKGLQSHQLARDSVFPVCSPELARRLQRSRDGIDWASQTLLHSIGFAQGWSHWLAAAQIKRKPRNVDIEFDSVHLCMETACMGHGIALARNSFAAEYMESKRLVPLRLPALEAKDNVYLTLGLGLGPQASATIFRDYLLARLKARAPLGAS